MFSPSLSRLSPVRMIYRCQGGRNAAKKLVQVVVLVTMPHYSRLDACGEHFGFIFITSSYRSIQIELWTVRCRVQRGRRNGTSKPLSVFDG